MKKISKTGFINLIRCNRFAGLSELYHNKMEGLVSFSEDLEDIMSADNDERKRNLIDLMFDETDGEEEDLIYPSDNELEVMMEYYDQVEELSARVIKNKFKGKLTYDKDTRKQKRFSFTEDGYQFYAFLDAYLENEEFNAVFESKATTTNKFLKLVAGKEPIFTTNIDGILQLKSELGYDVGPKGILKENVLFDRYSDAGGYVYDLAYQRLIIEKLKLNKKPTRYYLAVLNSEYVFDGTYENGKPKYSDEIIKFVDLTKVTERYLPKLEKDLKTIISRLDDMNSSPVPLGKFCQRKKTRQCVFYPICFKDLPKDNILTYIFNHVGFKDENNETHLPYDLINSGKTHMLDIPREWLTRPNNIIQYDVIKTGKRYFDKEKIIAGINELKYPIYHLDFESFPCPLPRFKYEKPHSQSLFQFSIHVEHQPGISNKETDHYSFLAKDHQDRREELVKALVDTIKLDGGSVAVYNVSFEKTRIRELGEMFPRYQDRLQDIASRLFDILDIVKTKSSLYEALGFDKERAKMVNFYDERLEGSYSIKKVLPLFTNLNYKDLVVQNGLQAYAMYAKFPSLPKEQFKEGYQNLVNYCKQDTWAMVEILKGLRKEVM